MDEKYLLPLSYTYKEGYAGEIAIGKQVFEDLVLQLRAGESRLDCPEKACILGSNRAGEIVRFYFDAEGVGDRTRFSPDIASLEQVVRLWKQRYGVEFAGLIHTHPHEDALSLSPKDLQFTRALLALNPSLKRVIMGILAQGKMVLYCFERDYLE